MGGTEGDRRQGGTSGDKGARRLARTSEGGRARELVRIREFCKFSQPQFIRFSFGLLPLRWTWMLVQAPGP